MRKTSAKHDPSKDTPPVRSGHSFILYCRHCEAQQLIPHSNVESKHRTSEGVVGYVRCGFGHLVIHQFAAAYPKPKPPASVIALRALEQDTPTEWPVARS